MKAAFSAAWWLWWMVQGGRKKKEGSRGWWAGNQATESARGVMWCDFLSLAVCATQAEHWRQQRATLSGSLHKPSLPPTNHPPREGCQEQHSTRRCAGWWKALFKQHKPTFLINSLLACPGSGVFFSVRLLTMFLSREL
jgi:hypothetical protein